MGFDCTGSVYIADSKNHCIQTKPPRRGPPHYKEQMARPQSVLCSEVLLSSIKRFNHAVLNIFPSYYETVYSPTSCRCFLDSLLFRIVSASGTT